MAELEKFSALYGKIDYPADLLTIPFEVLEYRTRLGLTTSEFEFICWIFHLVNKDFNEIRDKDISRRKVTQAFFCLHDCLLSVNCFIRSDSGESCRQWRSFWHTHRPVWLISTTNFFNS